jgi:peptide/nickel transport system permease protein/dipeptide transport system permease protein
MKAISWFILRRLVAMAPVLLCMSFIVFCIQSFIPADPARAIVGPSAPIETVNRIRDQLGLNDPLLVQYTRFVTRLAHGDLGTSVRTRQSITADARTFLPATTELSIAALSFGICLAIAIATFQAALPKLTAFRYLLVGIGSAPVYLTALLMVYVFSFRLSWFPGSSRIDGHELSGPTGMNVIDGLISGRPDLSLNAIYHLALPAIALGLPVAAAVGQTLSGSLHDVLRQQYAQAARGRGLSEFKIILRHGLRNSAAAPLAMTGLQVRLLFGNLLIVERVFGWPGLGSYMVQSFASADLPAILGVSLLLGAFYIAVGAIVDLLQVLADPRVAGRG